MLVLSRKLGERILLGNGVVVTVLEVKGGRVRLGIEAPQAVRIVREELAGPRQDPKEAFKKIESRPSLLECGDSSPLLQGDQAPTP